MNIKIKFNEKGQALVMVVFFAAIAMLMILALLYMVLRGQALSGMHKRYESALDAGYAGVGTTTAFLDSGLFYQTTDPAYVAADANDNTSFPTANQLTISSQGTTAAALCFSGKVFNGRPTTPTADVCWTQCAGIAGACDITNTTSNPDIEYSVTGVNTNFYVYAKITDSRRGITAQRPPGGLEVSRGFVNRQLAPGVTIQPQAYFYYTVEVQSQETNRSRTKEQTKETSNISFDYAY